VEGAQWELGAVAYARSLSKEKALQPEVLIAYQMNGRDLSIDHGYPVRAMSGDAGNSSTALIASGSPSLASASETPTRHPDRITGTNSSWPNQ
jgi:hypothetical protein